MALVWSSLLHMGPRLGQGHTEGNWHYWNMNPGLADSKPWALNHTARPLPTPFCRQPDPAGIWILFGHVKFNKKTQANIQTLEDFLDEDQPTLGLYFLRAALWLAAAPLKWGTSSSLYWIIFPNVFAAWRPVSVVIYHIFTGVLLIVEKYFLSPVLHLWKSACRMAPMILPLLPKPCDTPSSTVSGSVCAANDVWQRR